ncbi:MAG: hypothetical protein PHX80_05325 [Candidatus Nanoarchaeia archaeon]|nr:hypothetical protein [Candidatus Nanoarchaeia archaeon]
MNNLQLLTDLTLLIQELQEYHSQNRVTGSDRKIDLVLEINKRVCKIIAYDPKIFPYLVKPLKQILIKILPNTTDEFYYKYFLDKIKKLINDCEAAKPKKLEYATE